MGDGSGQQVGRFNSSFASVFGSPFDNTHAYQSWQIINSSSLPGAVVLRARTTGPYLYLNSMLNMTCDPSGESCTPCTESTCDPWLVPGMSNDLGAGAQWFIEPWSSSDDDDDGRPDDGYYMYNSANGSSYHLDIQDNGSWIWLNDNVTQTSNQAWDFPTVGSIDDETFSTVSSTTAPATSSPTIVRPPPPKPTNTSTDSGSSGLSTSAEGAIGGAIGGVAVLLLIVLGLWWFRRRSKRRHSYKPAYQDENGAMGRPQPMVELPDNQRPAELDDTSFKQMADTSVSATETPAGDHGSKRDKAL